MSAALIVVIVLAVLAVAIAIFLLARRAKGVPGVSPTRPVPAPPGKPPEAPPKVVKEARVEPPSVEKPEVGPPPPPAPAPPPPPAPAPEEAGEVEEPEAPEEEVEEAPPPRMRDRLGRARGLLSGYLGSVTGRSKIDDESWEELEEALIRADVGVATTSAILENLRQRVKQDKIKDPGSLTTALSEEMRSVFDGKSRELLMAGAVGASGGPAEEAGAAAPAVTPTTLWLFVGVNGVGKTTTIGKLAMREVRAGRSVVMAAGDTFRAAAAEQLELWAQRTGADIVRGAEGSDPGAVVFDAVQRAISRGADLVLADTAGRLHTKINLMEELKKVRRVADRTDATVTEVLLVVDATTGQNGLVQAKQFAEAVGVTGVVLTKLDGTAKGGIALAIEKELGIPIKLVGLGEGPADLVTFDPAEFVDAILTS